MKKFLLPVLLFFSFFCFAQKNIETKWKTIDSLELQGRNESAIEIVLEIIDSSQKEGDYTNFIKAKLFYYKFYQVNHKQSNKKILSDLYQSIAEIPVPFKNVLLSYKASFLDSIFKIIAGKFGTERKLMILRLWKSKPGLPAHYKIP